MKKLITFLFILCGFCMAHAALTALHIHTASRGVITLLLADEPVLTFNDDRSMTIETPSAPDTEPIKLDFDDIETCEYGDTNDYESDAIENVNDDNTPAITVLLTSSSVTFGNLSDDATVEVYSINGTLALKATPTAESFTIDRSTLPHGVYIVRIGKFVTKLSI